jgi:hypothetical protein
VQLDGLTFALDRTLQRTLRTVAGRGGCHASV